MTVEAEDHHLRCREAQHRLRDQVADLQARNDRLRLSIEAHAGTESMCRDGHQRVRYSTAENKNPNDERCPMCILREESK